MRITQKLGVLVAVPLCAVSGFGAIALVNSTSGAVSADHLWSLMNTANAAGQLICELQDERTLAAVYLTSAGNKSALEDLTTQIGKTDAAVRAYKELAGRLPFSTDTTAKQVQQIDSDLNQLKTLRTQYRSGAAPALSAVTFQYRIVIADLALFRTGVAQAGGATPAVATKIQAANQLYLASEYTGEEEATVLRVAINQPLTQSAQQEIAAARRGYSDALESFDPLAAGKWAEVPDQALVGADIAQADLNENTIARAPLNAIVHVNPDSWTVSMSARREALDKVQHDLNQETLSDIEKIRSRERTLAGLEAASIAGTLLIAVVVSLRLGRPMIRGLRELRDGAHAVAYEHLPAAVESLRATGSLTGRTPEEFAEQAGQAVRATSKDELGAVARAFNAVHTEAIRTAAEQVLLRAGVGATFVALARRGERLTGALTMELDRAEQDEQDPDRLARLFVLDHLAARMSRNNESLLVLGGEGTARVRDTGVPLNDVIRAALGRIERYTRVDLTVVDPGIVVSPSAVDHLVHLCAELLDNATTFSAPDSRVTVEARLMADRVIVQIADRGIGMTPAQRSELNARLASPRQVDVTTVRAMGLTVVAHLASWYGIDIELRPRPEGGTIAELMLPTSLYSTPGHRALEPGQAEAIEAAAWATPGVLAGSGHHAALTASGASPDASGVSWTGQQPAEDGSGVSWIGHAPGADTARVPRAAPDGSWSDAVPAWDEQPLSASWHDQADASSTSWPSGAQNLDASWGSDPASSGASWPNPVAASAAADQAALAGHTGYISQHADLSSSADSWPGHGQTPAIALPAWPGQTPADSSGDSPADTSDSRWPSASPVGSDLAAASATDWPSHDFPTPAPAGGVGREWAADDWPDQGSADPAPARHAAAAMTPVPPPGLAPADEPQLSPWLRPAQTPSPSHAAMPVTMSGAPAWPAAPSGPMPSEATEHHSSVPQPATHTVHTAPAAPSPPPTPPQPQPQPQPPQTTLHGLPIRVPMSRIPAEAVAAGAPENPQASIPAERDPEKVSATMAAYARGLTGRASPSAGPPSYPYPYP